MDQATVIFKMLVSPLIGGLLTYELFFVALEGSLLDVEVQAGAFRQC